MKGFRGRSRRCSRKSIYDAFIAYLDADGVPSSSVHIGTMLNDDLYRLHYDADDVLVMSGLAEGGHLLRANPGSQPEWTWSPGHFDWYGNTALTDGAVIVAGGAGGSVDLGAGALAQRGATDLVLAKVRR